jgi:hypothetical protein
MNELTFCGVARLSASSPESLRKIAFDRLGITGSAIHYFGEILVGYV